MVVVVGVVVAEVVGVVTSQLRNGPRTKFSTIAFSVPWFRSSRTVSPVCKSARPAPTTASGEAFRIEGLSDVPDCRPSPTVGK